MSENRRLTESRCGRRKSADARAAANDVAFDVDESPGGATICTLYSGQRTCGDRARSNRAASVRVEYTLFVPRDIRVNVGTGRGEITVERGEAR